MAFMRVVVVIARRLVGLPAFSPPAVSCLPILSASVLPATSGSKSSRQRGR